MALTDLRVTDASTSSSSSFSIIHLLDHLGETFLADTMRGLGLDHLIFLVQFYGRLEQNLLTPRAHSSELVLGLAALVPAMFGVDHAIDLHGFLLVIVMPDPKRLSDSGMLGTDSVEWSAYEFRSTFVHFAHSISV
jgi:hypothetical protein